ncbi:MAG: succinate dehydrogenase, cytochrome b556 subunit, partial [Proteobacteria bacterium]|nr:succinate dehydrogenase, cytochrome b556 subunit [Pseudomonadota bacterium]
AWWLTAAAVGGDYYEWVAGILGSPVGLVFLAGWSIAFFYHLGNGIRHLLWDAGIGLEIRQFYFSGWSVVAFTVVATVIAWWCAWARLGGAA